MHKSAYPNSNFSPNVIHFTVYAISDIITIWFRAKIPQWIRYHLKQIAGSVVSNWFKHRRVNCFTSLTFCLQMNDWTEYLSRVPFSSLGQTFIHCSEMIQVQCKIPWLLCSLFIWLLILRNTQAPVTRWEVCNCKTAITNNKQLQWALTWLVFRRISWHSYKPDSNFGKLWIKK